MEAEKKDETKVTDGKDKKENGEPTKEKEEPKV